MLRVGPCSSSNPPRLASPPLLTPLVAPGRGGPISKKVYSLAGEGRTNAHPSSIPVTLSPYPPVPPDAAAPFDDKAQNKTARPHHAAAEVQ